MRGIRYILFLFLFLSLGFTNSFAARFWIATTASNWNNIANWSNVTGGAGGFSVPITSDDVNFDSNGIGNCTIDAVVNIKTITVSSGYSGTIFQGVNSITTTGTASFSGGTFSGGSAAITIPGVFTLSGTAFTSTTATLELRSNAAFTSGSFAHNNGTTLLSGSGAITISGTSPVFYILEFVGKGNSFTLSSTGNITVVRSLNTSGTLFYNLLTGTIDVQGDINSSNTANGCGGDAIVNINGTGTQNFNGSTVAGAGAMPQLNINKVSGTLNLTNFPSVSNNFTYTAGTVSPGTSTLCFIHGSVGSYAITGSLTLTNLAFVVNSSGLTATIGAATTLTVTAIFTITGAGNVTINTGNINVNGDFNLANTATGGGGSATISLVGTADQTIDGTTLTVNQSRLPIIVINKPSGTLFLANNISFSNNVTYLAGTVNATTSTFYVVNNLTIAGSFSVYNFAISAVGSTTLGITNTVTVTNDFTIGGSTNVSINTGTIATQGNIIITNTGVGGGGTGTILINGTGAQSITSTGVVDQGRFPNVTISKISGTLTFPSLITVRGNWTYTSGTLDVTTNNSTVVFENTLTITGSHTLNNVTFFASNNYTFTTAAGTTLTVSGTMNMTGVAKDITLNSGNINLNGDLVLTNTGAGGGTTVISFVSGANQSIISSLPVNQNCLPAITISKSGGTLTFPVLITVKGNWTYTSGTLDVATNNSTVVFASPLGSTPYSITGTHTLNNVTFEGNNNNTATVTTGTLVTVAGTLSTTGTSNVFINSTVTGATAISALGDIMINNTSTTGGGTGLILINGTGAQALTSTVAASQGLMPYIQIQKTSGTLTLTGIISECRDWTYISGTVDASTNTSTVVFGGNNLTVTSAGMNFHHVTVTSSISTLGNGLFVNGNLTINGTGTLAPAGNTINLKGNWTNRATAGFTEATSTVSFAGSTLQTITTPGGENFTNLTVNNSGTGIQLINNVTVATSLNMTKGNIDLNGTILTLGLSAASKGTLFRTIGTIINTGSFIRWFDTSFIADGTIAGLFPVGTAADYRPLSVSAPATKPTTGGSITVAYTDASTNSTVSFADGASTVSVRKDLNWALSTNSLAGGSYNLRVEGTGWGTIASTSDLRLTLVNSVVGTAATNAGTVTDPQVNRTALALADLSNTFYVGSVNSSNSSLPVTLVSFVASVCNELVRLDWETATELNNDYFTTQRSHDGVAWEDLKIIDAAGNSTSDIHYASYDEDPFSGVSYYRLEQTDFDKQKSYSPITSVTVDQMKVYPNPVVSTLIIESASPEEISTTVYDYKGQAVNVPFYSVNDKTTFDVSSLAAGIYFIHIRREKDNVIRSIIKISADFR